MSKDIQAIWAGKLVGHLSRKLGKGQGSAITGLYALKIEPQVIESLIQQIPRNIIVTGTNGKSTTTRLLVSFARAAGLQVVTNPTGSNLERGIASSLINASNLRGQISGVDLGIWELDEAAFRRIVGIIKPEVVVVINALRDQLDRYGEVDSVISGWSQAIKALKTKPYLVLNGDDANVASLSSLNSKKVSFFGLDQMMIEGEKSSAKKVKADVLAKNIDLNGLEGSMFEVVTKNDRVVINLPIGGAYQIYNFLAAYIVAKRLEISDLSISKALSSFKPIFGRVERVRAKNGKELIVSLIKNPVGAGEVLELVANVIRPADKILIGLNDNFADGQDVSWIWDVEFEKYRERLKDNEMVVSGTRAEEMVLRLKYAGFDSSKIYRENDIDDALGIAMLGSGRVFVLPTYTVLLKIENMLKKQGLKKEDNTA